jgi:hypothetical protein
VTEAKLDGANALRVVRAGAQRDRVAKSQI